ncbi:uncharacterized protein ACRADG_008458 [Cochliomyia hominivorax]
MLKLSSDSGIKCGEIFCNNLKKLTIFCTFCEMKLFHLDDFLKHLENLHFEDSKELHEKNDDEYELDDNVLEYYVEELVEGNACEVENSCKNKNEFNEDNLQHEEEQFTEYEDSQIESSFEEEDNVELHPKGAYHRDTFNKENELQGKILEFDEHAVECSFEQDENELQDNVLEDDLEDFSSIADIEIGSEEEKELQCNILKDDVEQFPNNNDCEAVLKNQKSEHEGKNRKAVKRKKQSLEIKSVNKIYEFEDEVLENEVKQFLETRDSQSVRSLDEEINEFYDDEKHFTEDKDYELDSSSNLGNNLEEKSEGQKTYEEKGSDREILRKKIHKEQNYNCPDCQQNFALKKVLDKHVLEVHNGYKCSQCDKRFRLSHHHRRHEQTHKRTAFNGDRKYPCKMTECSKIFTDPEVLKRHLEVHNLMPKEFVCEFENCGKSFDTKSRLTAHKHTHRKVKNFVCDTCGFGCRAYGTLTIHQRIHTGEKPYACEICDRRFISTTAVNRHMLTHSNVRQFVCEICQTAFSTYGVLQRHRFIHSDKKTFQCKFCDKAFKQVHGLDGHMRRIHLEPKEKKS